MGENRQASARGYEEGVSGFEGGRVMGPVVGGEGGNAWGSLAVPTLLCCVSVLFAVPLIGQCVALIDWSLSRQGEDRWLILETPAEFLRT